MIDRSRLARLPAALLIAAASIASADAALAKNQNITRCWKKLDPQTLVEVGHVQKNAEQFAQRQNTINATRRPAALLLSYGSQRTAFSAGLIFGWGETGYRPVFDLVTAVGPSAAIAPFAFVGAAGDQTIADMFACTARSWKGYAGIAISRLDETMLARIRQGHQNGRRLMIALKGSAARPQTVWDIGKIAASRHPDALRQVRSIIAASVDLTTRVPVSGIPVKAGQFSQRNHTFRVVGAGRPFLFKPNLVSTISNWYVVHNSALFNDELADYAGKRQSGAIKSFTSEDILLRPVFDILSHARQSGANFRIAVIRPRRLFYPQTEFDQTFMQDIFRRAYRYARMGRLWQTDLSKQ